MKEHLKVILLSAVPAFLLFAGKSSYISTLFDTNNLLPVGVTKTGFEFWCFFIGIVVSSVVIPSQLIKAKRQIIEKDKLLVDLVGFNKKNFISSLKTIIKKPTKELRTRIFVPEHSSIIQRIRKKKKSFSLKEIPGLSDPLNVRHLTFEVSPTIEGAVGKVYSERKVVIYHSQAGNTAAFSLNEYQKMTTVDVKFICAGPIFNKKKEIVAVLTVDSDAECVMDANALAKCEQVMTSYCSFVGVNVNL